MTVTGTDSIFLLAWDNYERLPSYFHIGGGELTLTRFT